MNTNEGEELEIERMGIKEDKIDIGFTSGDIIKVDIGGQEYVFMPGGDTSPFESVTNAKDVCENQDSNSGQVCLVEVDMCTVEGNTAEDQSVEPAIPDNNCPSPVKKKRTRTGKGGRWDDDVWDYFNYKRDKSGKKSDVSCRYCKYRAKWPKIERLRRHFYETCPEAKRNVSKDSTLQGKPKPKEKDPSKMVPTRHTKTALDLQIARFIFSSKLRLSVVENPEFVNLIRILKPSYQLPTRLQLETSILDKVYEDVVGEYSKTLQGKSVTVMQCGWMSTEIPSVVSHTLSVECKSTHILNAVTVENKTLETCANLLLEAVEEGERLHKCSVVAVVSDNTDTMPSVVASILDKRPDLYVYSCNTRLLNLTGKAVSQGETLQEVRKIQSFFAGHVTLKDALTELKGSDPVLPNGATWISEYACLKNFLKNHPAYSEMVTRRQDVPEDIANKLMDLIFVNNVSNSIKNLKPIAKALKALQVESSTLSHAVKFWIHIKREVEVPTAFANYFAEVLQLALTPFACAAYLLHPKFRGEGLAPAYSALGLQWLDQKCSQYVLAQMKLSQGDKHYYPAALMRTETVEGVYEEVDDDTRKNLTSAATWWKEMGKNMGSRLPQGLAELAARLQQLPASTSSTEKCLSLMAPVVMTETQNRIGGDKAAKLCSVYRTLCDINRITPVSGTEAK